MPPSTAVLQNDTKALMKTIEESLQRLHAQAKAEKERNPVRLPSADDTRLGRRAHALLFPTAASARLLTSLFLSAARGQPASRAAVGGIRARQLGGRGQPRAQGRPPQGRPHRQDRLHRVAGTPTERACTRVERGTTRPTLTPDLHSPLPLHRQVLTPHRPHRKRRCRPSPRWSRRAHRWRLSCCALSILLKTK